MYLGTAPVYWLPGVSLQTVAAAKALLASLSVLSVLVEAISRNQLRFPAGLLGPPGFLILVLMSTPAIIQAKDVTMSLAFLFDLIIGIGFLWCFAILAREGADLPKLFLRSLYLIAAAAFVTLYVSATALNVASPVGTEPLSSTGFGGGRTGWSNGLSLYLPATLLLFVRHPRLRYPALLQIVIVSVLLGSQALSGGRAGLLASVFVLAAFLTVPRARISAAILLTVLAIIAVVLLQQLLEHLRITDLLQSGSFFTRIEDFSASRLAGYVLAVEHIRDRPLLGHGFGHVLLQIPYADLLQYGSFFTRIEDFSNSHLAGHIPASAHVRDRPLLGHDFGHVLLQIPYVVLFQRPYALVFEIHNLWLKLATESGVLLPLSFAFVVIRVLVGTRRSTASLPPGDARVTTTGALVLIILVGLILSQFEPRFLLGSFQNSALWWAAIGWSDAVGRGYRSTSRTH